jgi:hypothetical protein
MQTCDSTAGRILFFGVMSRAADERASGCIIMGACGASIARAKAKGITPPRPAALAATMSVTASGRAAWARCRGRRGDVF